MSLSNLKVATLKSLIDRGCGISTGLEKISKTKSRRGWNSREGWKKVKILIAGEAWLLNCFFLSFSNHESYIIMNICIYNKIK